MQSKNINIPLSSVWVLAGSLAIIYTGFGIVLPVFPKFLQENNAGESISLGILIASFAIAQIIFAPLYGRLSDRGYGRRPFILLALFGYGMGNFLYAFFARDLASMILVRIFEGITVAGLLPVSQALITDLTVSENRAKYLGILTGSSNVGLIIGPALGGILFDIGGFILPFVISGILSFIALIFAFILVPETKRKGNVEIVHYENSDLYIHQSKWKQFRSMFVSGGVIIFFMLLIISFLDFFSWIVIEPGIIFYFYNLGFTPLEFGYFVGVYGAFVAIGQIFFGGLSDRFGRGIIIFIGGIFHLLAYMALSFATTFVEILFMPVFAGIAIALIHPALTAFVGDIVKERYRGQVIGILAIPAQFAGVIGPLFGGYFAEIYDVSYLFWLSAFLGGLISIIILIQFLLINQKSTIESIS
ncbi:MAG: Tetracycline resistance protein, class B [Candidatus Heimdallarchaeota archaeon LC_3]|nr:MAG: Tetracycline resistance protein, class B [Candidatus Heimdallarchaeota archaeon LC_3]